jgi:alpha-tubulin suppressor-like RCC1 family protein
MVAGGYNHSLALKRDGTVMAWGDGSYGKLGDGTSVSTGKPTKVNNLSNITAIAVSNGHNLALRQDGILWACVQYI